MGFGIKKIRMFKKVQFLEKITTKTVFYLIQLTDQVKPDKNRHDNMHNYTHFRR